MALEHFSLAIQEADVDVGKIGELIHRVVLLMVFNRVSTDYNKGISVFAFLKSLVGDKMSVLDDTTQDDLKMKFVCFNHFLGMYYTPDPNKFEAIGQQRAAIVCKPGQNRIDHEIPLLMMNLAPRWSVHL